MLDPAATVEEEELSVESHIAQNARPSPPARRAAETGAMRFTYATGSRPLDGFTIKRGIGIGGFGEVYFAVSDAGKEVALKRVQRNLDIEVRGVSQCLNLKHPNLISLFDIRYDDEGQGWVVMEYVSGESLKEVIERNPHGLPRDTAFRWFREIARGVAYLHDHGIVHRDLKPGNIFLDEGIVKIGDYGLSKFISCSRRSGQTESVGTFHYMAPEIGKGVYGKEIDTYALGIILFEILTGRVPFDGESSQEIIMKHLTADPDLSAVPQAYRPLVARALSKDPGDRFPHVGELLAAVDAVSHGSAPAAPREAPPAEEPLYITDDSVAPVDEGIYLGPLKEHVLAAAAKAPDSKLREPVARAVAQAFRDLYRWWKQANLSTPVKMLLLVGGVILVSTNAAWLIPAAFFSGALYLIYFGLYAITQSRRTAPIGARPPLRTPQPVRAEAVPVAAPVRRSGRLRRPPQPWQEVARSELSHRTASERLGELSGSLLMSALVAVVSSLVMLLIAGKSLDGSVPTWTFFAWLSLTSVAGAWVVLALSKAWESSEGESFRRRFVMLIAGLCVGLLSFGVSDYLGVRLSEDLVVSSLPGVERIESIYEADGSPKLPAFLVYFAALFVVLRWWSQADPLRSSRLSMWTVICCILLAWLIHMFWQFPQPWGFMLAVSISTAVQLSAPWLPPRERSRIRRQVLEV